jgi:curved DNA-binding protein
MLKMVFKNYYKILDLETSHVSIEEIKQAYRQAAKKYHPDLNVGDTLAEEKIKDINEAYKTLSVPSSAAGIYGHGKRGHAAQNPPRKSVCRSKEG